MDTFIRYIIKRNGAEISPILTDLTKYAQYHPLIIKATPFPENPEPGQLFKIVEQPYPNLPIRVTYRVTVAVQDDIIIYSISGIPFLKPIIKYNLKQMADSETEVTFHLSIRGIRIFAAILEKKIIEAQHILMKRIQPD
ncbi:MAG: hypothetical protein KDC80_03740 [Saprospiraceae bacterium]|nr:hypothetical protein [Saprospiraceae bacterium]